MNFVIVGAGPPVELAGALAEIKRGFYQKELS